MDLSTYNPPLGTRPVSNPSHPYRAAKHTRPHSVRAPGVLATALMGIVLSIGCGGAAVRDTSGLSCATAGCDPMATCSVSSTQVMCACPAGFVDINGDGKACVDKNECALANPCSQNAVCTNTLGSYECACKTGFVGDGAICVDLNECLFNNGGCSPNADCTNTPGSRVCTCNKGFQGDGVVCTDINECANANGGCDMNATCTNTQGSRVCACAAGFQGNGETCMDIDECASRTARCDSTVACTNTLGSYKCGDCPAGYLGGGASGCVDINECLSNNGGCDANATCTNTPGGHTCACKAGYTGSGTRCVDADACATNPCPSGFTCQDLPAPAGTGPDGRRCVDINECAVGNGGCALIATCENSSGGVTCTCPKGYTGDGKTCADVNECDTNNGGCAPGATCINTAGSRLCSCPGGYIGDGISCTDVNECAIANGGCSANAACANTQGGRTCTCNSGYTGDGITCADINECLSANGGCHANATCTNTPGDRLCACNTGYSGNGITCANINECLTANGGCHANATCTDTPGSRTCACNEGYAGNGITCADINECLTENGGCHANATCTNTPGSRTCACNEGYAGDGFTCADNVAPVPGTAVGFTNIAATTLTLNWGRATDNVTAQGSLQYKVVKANTADALAAISLANAITGDDRLLDWTTDTITLNVTGLSEATTYYFAVLVRDAVGNMAMYAVGDSATLDVTAPSVGVISFATIAGTTLTVNWTAGTDTVTATANLSYKLVWASVSTDINTILKVNAITTSGAGLIMDWTTNTLTANITGLSNATTYYYAVLVRDEAGNEAIYTPNHTTTLDDTAPTVGTAISFSGISARAMTIQWGAATDNVTAQASLQYKLVTASSAAAIDTIGEVNAITDANRLMNWTANTLSFGATGLSESTTYYYAVLVRDAAGNMSLYTPASQATLASTPLSCDAGQVAVGVYGRSGWWLDQIGIRCAAFDGTTLSGTKTSGPSMGGGGGGGFTEDCPAGSALVEVRGGNGSTCQSLLTSYIEIRCASVAGYTLQSWSAKHGEGGGCTHVNSFDYTCTTGQFTNTIRVDAQNTGAYVGFVMGATCAEYSAPTH